MFLSFKCACFLRSLFFSNHMRTRTNAGHTSTFLTRSIAFKNRNLHRVSHFLSFRFHLSSFILSFLHEFLHYSFFFIHLHRQPSSYKLNYSYITDVLQILRKEMTDNCRVITKHPTQRKRRSLDYLVKATERLRFPQSFYKILLFRASLSRSSF